MVESGEPKNRSTKSMNTAANNGKSKGAGKKVAFTKRRPRLPVLGKKV
jgi:hypothetical protein